MVPAASHVHRNDHAQGHNHTHSHVHGATSPHPAQAAPWSILRMTLAGRVSAALVVCAVLWGMVWLVLR